MNPVETRARCFQLYALGFSHPVPELVERIADGSFPAALAASAEAAVQTAPPSPRFAGDFEEFEASYIRLFQLGRRGQPQVNLNAADHDELLKGESRPEFLLSYSNWYRHFGLRTAEEEGELPDHLVCQLEFMAWLAHLEQRGGSAAQDYSRAQLDFLQRHLLPMLQGLVSQLVALREPCATREFYAVLLQGLQEFARELSEQLAQQAPTHSEPQQIAAVNLWG